MTYVDAIDASQYTPAQKLKLIYLILADGEDTLDRFNMIADAQADDDEVVGADAPTEELIQLAVAIWNSADCPPRSASDLDAAGDLAPLVAQLQKEGAWADMEPGWSR
jgi:hypothetical protein